MSGTPASWLRNSLLAAVLAAVVLLFIFAGALVRLAIVSAILAYIVDPVAAYFEARGLRRTGATAIVFLLVGLAVVGLLLLVYPSLAQEMQTLRTGDYSQASSALIAKAEEFLHEKLGFLGGERLNLSERLEQAKIRLSDRVLDFLFTGSASFLVELLALPFLVFFLVRDGRTIKRACIRMIPNRYFEFSLNLLHKMDKHLGNYLRGQFLDALLFGLMATLVLWILDVKYPLFIGAFAGAANLIPYLGPLVGATLAAVVTFLYSGDLTRVAYVGIAFMAVKLLDDAVIQPLVLARSVRMHPLAVVSVTIVGGQFFGILGMFLAVPVAGFIKIAVQESMRTLSRFRISRERAG